MLIIVNLHLHGPILEILNIINWTSLLEHYVLRNSVLLTTPSLIIILLTLDGVSSSISGSLGLALPIRVVVSNYAF